MSLTTRLNDRRLRRILSMVVSRTTVERLIDETEEWKLMVPHRTDERSSFLTGTMTKTELRLWDELSKSLDGMVHDYLARKKNKKLYDVKSDISDFRMPIVGYQTLKSFEQFNKYNISIALKDIKEFTADVSKRLDIKTMVSLYVVAFCEVVARGGPTPDLEKKVIVFDKGVSNCDVIDSFIEEQEELCDNWIAYVDYNFKKVKYVEFEPSFGKASQKIGGADADIIINDVLIDFKSGSELKDIEKNIKQICGYYLLSKSCFKDKERGLNKMVLYYPRYNEQLIVEGTIEQKVLTLFNDYLESPNYYDANTESVLNKANMYSFIIPHKNISFLTIKHFNQGKEEYGAEFSYIIFKEGKAIKAKNMLANVKVKIPEYFEEKTGIINENCMYQELEEEVLKKIEYDLKDTTIYIADNEKEIKKILTKFSKWNTKIVNLQETFREKKKKNYSLLDLHDFTRTGFPEEPKDTLDETLLIFETCMVLLGSKKIEF